MAAFALLPMLAAVGVLVAAETAASGLEDSERMEGRQLAVASVKTCPTDRLQGDLPIPFIGMLSRGLPEGDTLRTRFVYMEHFMRSVPFWQPLNDPKDVLPTALHMPEDAALAARRIDALIVGVLTIGLALVATTVPVGLVSLLGSSGSKEEESRLLIQAEAGAGEASQEEEEFEMRLGPVKTAVFAVYYVGSIVFLLVLTSWSKSENLMLGGAGLDWEVIWLWLVVVLSTDVVGYSCRAVQAAIMKRQLSLAGTAISTVMSVLPVLGPRVDLLKDCLFAASVFQLAACQHDSWRRAAGFWIGNASLLTIFLPVPALFWFETTRRDLAAEFWPALVARLRVASKEPPQSAMRPEISDLGATAFEIQPWTPWPKAELFAVPKLVAQCTASRFWTAVGEDLPQAVLAVLAMIVFEKYSGMLLVNLVISGGKIAAVFILRQIIGSGRLYLVDPVTCAAFLASYSDHLSKDTLHRVAERGLADYLAALLSAGFDKDAQAQKEDRDSSFRSGGDTPLHRAALVGHAGCVDLLLKAGAKKELKDYRSGLRLNAGRWIEICAGFVFCVTVASDSGEAMPLQPHSELFRG